MYYYLLAAALVLHAYFWGWGLAWWLSPREWRRSTWLLAPGWGLALQSAVVWFAAKTDLAGTNAYARTSELLPLALIAVAVWRRGLPRRPNLRVAVAGLFVLAATGWLYLSPMVTATRGRLTAVSLGSCDVADYAAGARVFQEFSRSDRTGFLGQKEVSGVGTADNFFEFFVRLNHFTPSALLAHNGTILGCRPHELVSISGVAVLLLHLPLVFLLARVALGLRGRRAAVAVVLYAIAAINAYAVHQGALGQLYAALGIAWLTVAAIGAGRAAAVGRSARAFAPQVLAALWLLAGSYNFILTVALMPAAGWLVLRAWQEGRWQPAVRVAVMLLAMLALCALLFWGRFDGLIERFRLFDKFDFGWPVPLLTPEGWLGLVRDPFLHGWAPVLRAALGLGVLAVWLIGAISLWRRRSPLAAGMLALVLVPAGGWAMLAWEAQTRANASYEAYKIVAVFLPGLLSGLLGWLVLPRGGSIFGSRWSGMAIALLLMANFACAGEFRRQMMNPPLRLETDTIALQALETDARFASFNIRVEEFWARLWANHFLLRKPQYFVTHSYEGRLNTPLRGEWDLSDGLETSVPLDPDAHVPLGHRFHLTRHNAAGRVDIGVGSGWYAPEQLGIERWRWSTPAADWRINNPSSEEQSVCLTLRVHGVSARSVELRLDGRMLATLSVDVAAATHVVPKLTLPAGVSILSLHADTPAVRPEGDGRDLSVALHSLELESLN